MKLQKIYIYKKKTVKSFQETKQKKKKYYRKFPKLKKQKEIFSLCFIFKNENYIYFL